MSISYIINNQEGSLTNQNINGGLNINGTVTATTISATTITLSNYSNLQFTGGTVSGPTNFTNGLTANTFSATTLYGDGSNLTGISVVGGEFTGGTVTGETIFTSGVTANSISADTVTANSISADTVTADYFYGDGSNLGGVVGLTYSDLGFTITSPAPTIINQDVILPYNSTVTYTGTLTVGSGYAVTVPAGTTLTILP